MSHGMEWRRFGRFIVISAGIAVLTVLTVAFARDKINSARQAELVEQLKTGMVLDLDGLAGRLATEQAELMPILPPEPALRIHQSGGVLTFDPGGFPKEFLTGLVYDIEHGCPVYTVTVQENSLTGEILFYNGDDKLVASLPPVKDYDIWWLFERFHPALYTRQAAVDEKTAWLMTLFDPLRLEFEFQLLPADYIETYAANAVASWPAPLESLSMAKGGGLQSKMLRQDRASTSIVVAAFSWISTNAQLTVQYPDDFTNRLEIFTCADLRNSWSLIATNLSTVGTNEIQWTDTTAGGVSSRFYAAHDADTDSDSDGLVDGREQRMYRTCATNIDTDGDGLVDGFSGLVGTNSYPGGATTNGIFVEGEMTWATVPAVFDTDADGMGDGWEVAAGHNPVDENDPPNVSGTIFYAGRQTGTVHVVAVTTSGSWSTNASCTLGIPAAYLMPHLEQTNYWLKAWMDTAVDGRTNATEACGVHTNAGIVITNRVTGKDIVLIDPDHDSDGVPDWWEVVYFGNVTNPATDPDGDNYNNQEEYGAGTDPTNTLSHPWNISGTVTYTGPQTGTVWVAACTDGATWNWARVTTNALPGAYTITHLPPGTNYWVRAWRDSNGDGQPPSTAEGYAAWEAWGTHSGNPVMLDTNVAGVDVTLADPDNDVDGLPDWWEVRYGLDSTAGGADAAVAWWKLDETTGTNAADSEGTNHGILNGFATTGWVAGVVGNGLLFDGSNTCVEVLDGMDLKPANLGVGLWIKPAMACTNGRSATFISKETGTKGYCVGYENGGLVFRCWSSGTACEVKWPCALTAGVPVHVVGMYGGSWQRLYVDAQLKAETNYNWETGFGNISQGTNALRMGAAVSVTVSNCFAGILDDVRITGGEWSSSQVHAVWELGADPDGDGLGNAEEYREGTDPGVADSDSDGMNDGWEVRYGLSPTSSADALADPDGDGYLNIYEAKRGSDPNSSNSVPVPTHVVTNGFSTIQAMINSVTLDYAVVQVKAGTYTNSGNRDIDFGGKKLVLVGEGAATNTVIDCGYAGRGFYFHSGETLLSAVKGLTVTKGEADRGAGIRCNGASPWINESLIVSNRPTQTGSSYFGAGLCVDAGTPQITACSVIGNGRTGGSVSGGGMALFDAALVSNTTLQGNNALCGAGIYFSGGAGETGRVVQCVVAGNAASFGGGIWASNRLEITDCEVNSNIASARGGGVWGAGAVQVMGGEVCGNQTAGIGGGLSTQTGGTGEMPVVTGVLVENNSAETGGGLAHYPGGEAPVTVSNCTIRGNVATAQGGVYVNSGSARILGSVVENNSAGAVGGIWINCPGKGVVEVADSRISGNTQAGGGTCGGIHVNKGSNDAEVVLRGLVISNNSTTVSNGTGGIWVNSQSSLLMENCVIAGNTGRDQGDGGGFLLMSSVSRTATVARCRILDNAGTLVGGLRLDSSGTTVVKECVFDGNESTGVYGGFWALHLDAKARVESSAFIKNRSSGLAGAGRIEKGSLQNCVIADNICDSPVSSGGFVGGYESGCVTARNTIAWGNSGKQLGNGIVAYDSCVQGGYTSNGSSRIITANPQLVDGYRLLNTNSPCWRAGSASGLPDADINGEPWAAPATPDIGCDGLVVVDSDNDGMNDEWETYFFNTLTNDGTGDTDNDGLSDGAEYAFGASPLDRDTDGDLMPDGYEAARGMNPGDDSDAGGDWNGDGIANSNEYKCSAFAIRATVADINRDDDDWNLLLNDSVVASCNSGNGWTDTQVVYVEQGTTARFMLQRPESGQWGGTDEYEVNFEPVDWPTNQAPWIPSPGNASLSATLPWDGETPPDVSGIYWEFAIPSNMLQEAVDPGTPQSKTEDPLNTINGNNTLSEPGLAVPCPAFDLAFERFYNSRDTATNGPLGAGWSHNLDWSLATASNAAYGGAAGTFKVLRTGDGASYWFKAETNGTFSAPPDVNLALALTNGEYRVTWPGGMLGRFDAGGVLSRLEDGFGTGLSFTNAAGRLASVTHDNGKALAFGYAGNRLTRVDSPSANLYLTFAYSEAGMLTGAVRVADGVEKVTRYDYEDVCHVLTQKVNAAGDVYAYSVGYVTNIPAWNGQPAVVTARGTGMSINPAADGWYSHTLDYTNPGGYATRVTYQRGDTNVVLDYAYDPVKMWIDRITGPGKPGTAAWSNTWTRYARDAEGNMTNEVLADASGETLALVAFYDDRHNVVSNGMAYLTNAAANWTRYAWNADDTLAAATDPAGLVTAFEYTNGLVSVVRECTNGVSGVETRFSYTAGGLLASVTNANGNGVRYEHDAAGYVSRVVPALGPEARLVRNGLGQVMAVIVPGEAGGRTNALTVNALGQVTAVTHPDGLVESFAFDVLGRLTNSVDTAGRTNVLAWLPTGKPASVSRWLDGPSPTNATISFAYDKQFNTLRITDPMGRAVERYTLDMQDRPVVVTNLEGQSMTVNWGVGDYVRNIKRFDGTGVTNTFDNAGRLAKVQYPGEYHLFNWTANGLLTQFTGKTCTLSNRFDALGRLYYQQHVLGGRTNAVAYQFDPVGNVTNVAVSNTPVRFGWTLDAAERPVTLAAYPQPAVAGAFRWNYNTNNGLAASVTNGVVGEFIGFDVMDRATNLVWRKADGTVLRSFGYGFDRAGMVTNVAREDGGWTAYTYDSLDRLTSERRYGAGGGLSNSASWTYDLAGNRTMAVTNGVTNFYRYATGNSLTNFGAGTLVQYDLAGNTTNLQYSASRKLGLVWDGKYQLVEVRTNGVLVEKYDYDPLGRRVRITAGTVTNTMVYDGPHVVAEYSNNVLARSYAYAPGIDDALSLTTYGSTTNTYYYLKDNLGSVHALVNTNGAVVEQYRYSAWGEVTVLGSNGTVLAASAYGNRVTWQGREYSAKTGLLFFRSRYYLASIGRWLSKDRIGIAGGENLYKAFGNAPTVFVDPTGLCEEGIHSGRDYMLDYYRKMKKPWEWLDVLAEGDIGQTQRRSDRYSSLFGNLRPDQMGNVGPAYASSRLLGLSFTAGMSFFGELFTNKGVWEGAGLKTGFKDAAASFFWNAVGAAHGTVDRAIGDWWWQ